METSKRQRLNRGENLIMNKKHIGKYQRALDYLKAHTTYYITTKVTQTRIEEASEILQDLINNQKKCEKAVDKLCSELELLDNCLFPRNNRPNCFKETNNSNLGMTKVQWKEWAFEDEKTN